MPVPVPPGRGLNPNIKWPWLGTIQPDQAPVTDQPGLGQLDVAFEHIPDWSQPPDLGSRIVKPPPAVLGKPEPVVANPPFDYDQNLLNSRVLTPPTAAAPAPVPPPVVAQGKTPADYAQFELGSRSEIPPPAVPLPPPTVEQAKQPQDYAQFELPSRDVTPPPAVLGQAKTIQAKQPQDFPESLLNSRELTPPVTPAGAQFPPPTIAQAKQSQDFPDNLLGSRDIVPPPAVLGQAKTIQAEQPQDYAQNELGSREITPPPTPTTQPVPPPLVIQGEFQPDPDTRREVSQTLQGNPGGGSYAPPPGGVIPPYTVQGNTQNVIQGPPPYIDPNPQDPFSRNFLYFNASPPIYRAIVPGSTNQFYVQEAPAQEPPPDTTLGSRALKIPPPGSYAVAQTIYRVISAGQTNQGFQFAPVVQPDPPIVDKARLYAPPARLASIFTAVRPGASNQMVLASVVQPDPPVVDPAHMISPPPAAAAPSGATSSLADPNWYIVIH